ncbi:MAG: metallophosphoesterase [Bacteroidota bacterium]
MKFERQSMVGWFDVRQLWRTGVKTVISTTLGNYADRREIQAALSPNYNYFDLSDKFEDGEDIWVDYISDLGDGFNSTYTIAHLLGKLALKVGGKHLPQGNILIMGGDSVYPTPEIEEYNNRLKGPYKAAFPDPDDENYWLPKDRTSHKRQRREFKEHINPLKRPPFLFAIPGNHDWYDGLSNFIKIFTQERRFGNWQTLQKRSYFAIKLKNDYWIWGTDVQLDSDIDQPQKDYFQHIGSVMPDNSKIILCTAEPAWVFRSMAPKNTSYDRLKYFVRNYIDNENGWLDPEFSLENERKANKKHQIIATLTGDLHHYAHYCEEKNGQKYNHLFTAGGGGAFLHPTHNLPTELEGLSNEKPILQACYPDKKTSKLLSYKNFLFPIINKQFFAFMGFFYVLFAWLLWKVRPGETRIGILSESDQNSFVSFLRHSPLFSSSFSVVLALIIFSFYKFTDTGSTKNKFVWIIGIIHGIAHILSLFLMIWFLAHYNKVYNPINQSSQLISFVFILQLFLFGGFCGALIMGAYLFFANHFFSIHLTESFSGLAIQNYKHFLRIHFEKDQITVYPLGVDRIVKNWKNYNTDDFPLFKIGQPSSYIRYLYYLSATKKIGFLKNMLDYMGYHDGTKPKVHIIGNEPIVIK